MDFNTLEQLYGLSAIGFGHTSPRLQEYWPAGFVGKIILMDFSVAASRKISVFSRFANTPKKKKIQDRYQYDRKTLQM